MDGGGAPDIRAQLPGAAQDATAQVTKVQGTPGEAGPHEPNKAVVTKLGLRSQLSLVPEQSFIISWRIELLVIGCGAEQWCIRAVGSKIAEAYRPPRNLHDRENSERLWLFVPLQPRGDGSPSSFLGSVSTSDFFGSTSVSVSWAREELARLRFTPIEGFGDNLSLPKDPAKCFNYIAVLLVVPTDTSLEERIWDFQMRLSELSFRAQHMRPHVVMLTFKTNAAQDTQLQQFTAKWRDRVPIEIRAHQEDSEEEIMEALAGTCRGFIEEKLKRAQASGTITEASVQQAPKRCPTKCAVM